MADNERNMRLYACLPTATVALIRAMVAYVITLNRHPFDGKPAGGWMCRSVNAMHDDRAQRTEIRVLFVPAPPSAFIWDPDRMMIPLGPSMRPVEVYGSRDWHLFDGFSRSRRRARRLFHVKQDPERA